MRFATSRALTVIKFPSVWRRNSYRTSAVPSDAIAFAAVAGNTESDSARLGCDPGPSHPRPRSLAGTMARG